MFLGGRGNRLKRGVPAALAHFIWVDEIVGRFAALLAFQRHRPRHAAYLQPARARLPFDPKDELHRHVSVTI